MNIIWTKNNCSFCLLAKAELTDRGILFEERNIQENWTKEQLIKMVPNAKTVPQILLAGIYIGGYNELMRLKIASA